MNTISHLRIENLQKSVACHRAAFDFDMGFILQSVQLVAGLDLEHEVENGPPKKKRGRKKKPRKFCFKAISIAVPPDVIAKLKEFAAALTT